MSEIDYKKDSKFWEFLSELQSLQDKKSIKEICLKLNIKSSQFDAYYDQIKNIDFAPKRDEDYIFKITNLQFFNLKLNLTEYMEINILLKDHFEMFGYELESKKKFDLFVIDFKENDEDAKRFEQSRKRELKRESFCSQIQKMINASEVVMIKLKNENTIKLYPHRVVYLDNVLCLIGESADDQMLCYFSIDDILELTLNKEKFESNHSQLEINAFIEHSRLVNGNEERLVLKIQSKSIDNFIPEHHYLGNPFVTKSARGDAIWAATVERCEALYEWLYSFRDSVEILDPGYLRKEFASYCQKKKIEELKKAS